MSTEVEVTITVYAYLIVPDGESVEEWTTADVRRHQDDIKTALTAASTAGHGTRALMDPKPMLGGMRPSTYVYNGCEVEFALPTPEVLS